MTSRLNWLSQARVRSTTHLCLPSFSLLSTPLRAMRGVIPLFLRAHLHRSKSYPLSPCSLLGLFLLPLPSSRGFLIGLMASTTSVRALESWTLAGVQITASGTPLASTTTWRFVPGLPLSVGLGPVHSPPFWPLCLPSLQQHATTLSCLHLLTYPAALGGASLTHRLVASLAVFATGDATSTTHLRRQVLPR
jgi:hypothetical protein